MRSKQTPPLYPRYIFCCAVVVVRAPLPTKRRGEPTPARLSNIPRVTARLNSNINSLRSSALRDPLNYKIFARSLGNCLPYAPRPSAPPIPRSFRSRSWLAQLGCCTADSHGTLLTSYRVDFEGFSLRDTHGDILRGQYFCTIGIPSIKKLRPMIRRHAVNFYTVIFLSRIYLYQPTRNRPRK